MLYDRAIKTLRRKGFTVQDAGNSFSARKGTHEYRITALRNGRGADDLTCLRVSMQRYAEMRAFADGFCAALR